MFFNYILKIFALRRFYAVLMVLLLMAVAYVGIGLTDCYLELRDVRQAVSCTIHQQWVKTGFGEDIVVNAPNQPQQEKKQRKRTSSVSLSYREETIAPDVTPYKASLVERYKPAIQVGVATALVFSLIFFEIHRRTRRKYLQERERKQAAPFGLAQTVLKTHVTLSHTPDFFRTSEMLRTGHTPYLMLIEKHSHRDHHARFIEQLVEELRSKEVSIITLFYENDIRICWEKDKHEDGIPLAKLQYLYQGHKVLVCGEIDGFFNLETDDLLSWTEGLTKWEHVAVCTPKSPMMWGMREWELSQRLPLLPQTPDALLTYISGDPLPPFKFWVNANTFPELPSLNSGDVIANLRHYFDSVCEGQDVKYTKGSGNALFMWLCGCTLFSELRWGMTLAIGDAFNRETPDLDLLAAENITKLIRLPWFREGNIPPEIREALALQLSETEERVARAAILQVLQENLPPPDSVAQEEHTLSVMLQEARLGNTSLWGQLKLSWQLEDYALTNEINDRVFINYVNRVPMMRRVTANWASQQTLNIFFENGIWLLGFRSWVRATVLLAALGLLWLTFDPIALTRLHTWRGKAYNLVNADAVVDFYTMQGTDLLAAKGDKDAGEKATRAFKKAIQVQKQQEKSLKPLKPSERLLPEYNLAQAYLRDADTVAAAHQFAQLMQSADDELRSKSLSPVERNELKNIKADAAYNVGVTAYKKSQPNMAKNAFLDALEVQPAHLPSNYGLAAVLLKQARSASDTAAKRKYVSLSVDKIQYVLQKDPDYLDGQADILITLDSLGRVYGNTSLGKRLEAIEAIIRDSKTGKSVPVIVGAGSGTFKPLDEFICGLSRTKPRTRYGYVNAAGKLLIDTLFEQAYAFSASERLAAVRRNGRWGFINTEGNAIITYQYESAQPFEAGMATVRRNKKWGCIDVQGDILIPCVYDEPIQFIGDRAAVSRSGRNYFINKKGQCIENCAQEQWNVASVKVVRESNELEYVSLSPDGQSFVTAAHDNLAKVWNIDGTKRFDLRGHTDWVREVEYSPNGKYITTVSRDRKAKLWNAETGALLTTMSNDRSELLAVAVSPNSDLLAVGAQNGAIYLYAIPSGNFVRTISAHNVPLHSLVFTPQGLLLSAAEDGLVKWWDTRTGRQLDNINVHGNIQSAQLAPNGKLLLLALRNGTTQLWNTEPKKLAKILRGHTNWVSEAVFSPDGKYMMTLSYDGTAKVWNAQGAIVLDISGSKGAIRSGIFTKDNTSLITVSADKEIRIFKLMRE